MLAGTPGQDVIAALGGDDIIEGRDGADIVCAGDGADIVNGGAGDDVLDGGPGRDVVDGREGADRCVAETGDALGGCEATAADIAAFPIGPTPPAAPATATCAGRQATIVGTEQGDVITAGPGDDVIVALGGGDVIDAGEGSDLICSGAGRDQITAGPGDDVVDGGDDADRVLGGDVIDAGEGSDLICSGAGRDQITAGPGDDVVDGGDDADRVLGGTGADEVRGADGDDSVEGQDGDDRLLGGAGRDALSGGDDDDLIAGHEGDDVVSGDGGDDVLDGGVGRDVTTGGEGIDACTVVATPSTSEGCEGVAALIPVAGGSVTSRDVTLTVPADLLTEPAYGAVRHEPADRLTTTETLGDMAVVDLFADWEGRGEVTISMPFGATGDAPEGGGEAVYRFGDDAIATIDDLRWNADGSIVEFDTAALSGFVGGMVLPCGVRAGQECDGDPSTYDSPYPPPGRIRDKISARDGLAVVLACGAGIAIALAEPTPVGEGAVAAACFTNSVAQMATPPEVGDGRSAIDCASSAAPFARSGLQAGFACVTGVASGALVDGLAALSCEVLACVAIDDAVEEIRQRNQATQGQPATGNPQGPTGNPQGPTHNPQGPTHNPQGPTHNPQGPTYDPQGGTADPQG